MSYRICLITPGHIATDPRLVKEAVALSGAGMAVHLIFSQYMDYLVPHDLAILNAHQDWTFDVWDWRKDGFKAGLDRMTSSLLARLSGSERRLNRNFSWQLKKAITQRADLYIAHNLGALPVAVLAAEKNHAKCGFDAEDLHRFETGEYPPGAETRRKIKLEDRYIPQADYLTTSSPHITVAYRELFPALKPVTILNVFPKEEQVRKPVLRPTGPLRLFWFSQTIGNNRGLQDIIAAVSQLDAKRFELHLVGLCRAEVKAELEKNAAHPIYFYEPVAPDELITFAGKFDIGLALEPGFSRNNNFALSNKIFTYLQAGLCIIASDTEAQAAFMNSYPRTGSAYPKGDSDALAAILLYYDQDREHLLNARTASFELGKAHLNWELEQEKFLEVVDQILEKT